MTKTKVTINVKEAVESLKNLHIPFVKELGDSFIKNFDNIHTTSSIPLILSTESRLSYYYERFSTIELIRNFGLEDNHNVEEKKQFNIDQSNLIYSRISSEITYERIVEEATNKLNSLIDSQKPVANSLEILKLNTIANSWTAFETLCKDLWINTLNIYPKKYFKNSLDIIKSTDESDFSGKTININLLSKYDYNISNHLGTILSEKFDFTSVAGIKKAYSPIFKDDTDRFNFKNNDLLQELEIIRHVIVHRGGFIDPDFLKRTKKTGQLLNERLTFSYEEAGSFCNEALQSGVLLLLKLDHLLQR